MRLSEAIRLGAMTAPQAFGDFHVSGGSCALGAACDAVGLMTARAEGGQEFACALSDRFPVLTRRDVVCPVTGRLIADVAAIIVGLNDIHRWTREQIANWVEMLEPAETTGIADPQQADRAVAVPIG